MTARSYIILAFGSSNLEHEGHYLGKIKIQVASIHPSVG